MPVDNELYVVSQGALQREAMILDRRPGEAYVHYMGTDKRMDEWVSEDVVHLLPPHTEENGTPTSPKGTKRKRSESKSLPDGGHPSIRRSPPHHTIATDHLTSTKEQDEEAVIEHRRITAKRNFDQVIFGEWQMKTWYFSPYPVAEDADAVSSVSAALPSPASPSASGHGGTRKTAVQQHAPLVPESVPTLRTHGRTADLLASAGGVSSAGTSKATSADQSKLWVCDRCFKYMRDGVTWEVHMKKCDVSHPPGRKVYQRGAHIIWEVDGAEQKLYCQNLALFGKLFIDIKTIFFDCDNFMFYIATDAESRRDHVLGFFSKEKVSYDDWNLACIITFPPYQKKGYGMLLIEFSYELSRRAGKLGTPERPLSDLGLRSYLAYWTAVLVRFFRKLLGVEVDDPNAAIGGHHRRVSLSRKKKIKGFEGEVAVASAEMENEGPTAAVIEQPAFGSIRTTHTETLPDQSVISHLNIRCTLMDIARATGLRHEDVAFTMEDCGLLLRRRKEVHQGNGRSSRSGEEGSSSTPPEMEKEIIVVSAEMVERVAKQRAVKQKCILDPAHVLL